MSAAVVSNFKRINAGFTMLEIYTIAYLNFEGASLNIFLSQTSP